MKMRTKPQPNQPEPTESQEQQALFHWIAIQVTLYPELEWLYHIPNGGKRYKSTAIRLKKEGVKAGVPDLCLPVARGKYHGLYIEMKRQKSGTTTENQEDWLELLRKEGYCTAVCRGWEAAAKVLIDYLTVKVER